MGGLPFIVTVRGVGCLATHQDHCTCISSKPAWDLSLNAKAQMSIRPLCRLGRLGNDFYTIQMYASDCAEMLD